MEVAVGKKNLHLRVISALREPFYTATMTSKVDSKALREIDRENNEIGNTMYDEIAWDVNDDKRVAKEKSLWCVSSYANILSNLAITVL
jgi:hypothetical protein